MSAIRPAAVAGTFYPASPAALQVEVRECLRGVQGASGNRQAPKAIIAPHAGYIYSGPVAASAYAALAGLRGRVSRVVLVGPAHRVPVRGAAVPGVQAFATPAGLVSLDARALAQLARLPFVEVSDAAHAAEHCLEVHLPFLLEVLGDFLLVPVVIGGASPDQVATLLEEVWGGEETRVVVSSDLSHFLPYDAACRRDQATAQEILRLEPSLESADACGATPVNGLIEIARRRHLVPELVDLRNSGDTAGGRDRVVGYASFVFREPGDVHA